MFKLHRIGIKEAILEAPSGYYYVVSDPVLIEKYLRTPRSSEATLTLIRRAKKGYLRIHELYSKDLVDAKVECKSYYMEGEVDPSIKSLKEAVIKGANPSIASGTMPKSFYLYEAVNNTSDITTLEIDTPAKLADSVVLITNKNRKLDYLDNVEIDGDGIVYIILSSDLEEDDYESLVGEYRNSGNIEEIETPDKPGKLGMGDYVLKATVVGGVTNNSSNKK